MVLKMRGTQCESAFGKPRTGQQVLHHRLVQTALAAVHRDDDAERRDLLARDLHELPDPGEDQRNAVGGEDIGHAGDEVMIREEDPAQGGDAQIRGAVDEDDVVTVQEGMDGVPQDRDRVRDEVAADGHEGHGIMDLQQTGAGREQIQARDAAAHIGDTFDDRALDLEAIGIVQPVAEELGQRLAAALLGQPEILRDQGDRGIGLRIQVDDENPSCRA